jgi:hypothetical protein
MRQRLSARRRRIGGGNALRQMPQQAGRCIFCGKRGLTKEHIWPDWLRKVLGPSMSSSHFYSTSGMGRRRTFTNRTGSIQSRKLRIVCEVCNNGRMSRLQNNAKARLIPLIRGHHISLTEADHKILAAWSMMFTMVVEFLDPTTLATTQRERMEFSRIPAPNDILSGGINQNGGFRCSFGMESTARPVRPLVFVSFCGHFVVLPHSQQIDRHLVQFVHRVCRIEQRRVESGDFFNGF